MEKIITEKERSTKKKITRTSYLNTADLCPKSDLFSKPICITGQQAFEQHINWEEDKNTTM